VLQGPFTTPRGTRCTPHSQRFALVHLCLTRSLRERSDGRSADDVRDARPVAERAHVDAHLAVTLLQRLALARAERARVAGRRRSLDAHGVTDVGGLGVDVAFEVVGRSQTIAQAFAMARRGGTAVLVGAGSPEDAVTFSAMELFADAKSIVGCVYGSTDPDRDFPLLVNLIEGGQLDAASLVSARIGLDEVNEAFGAMVRGEVARSVIVFDGAGA